MTATGPVPAPGDDGAARIYDRGYRRYEGERRGVGGAVRSVAVSTAQRALGLRRSAGAKVLPVLSVAIAYLPAIVFVGISAFFGDRFGIDANEALPDYPEYYGFITLAIVLFAAFVAPEVLCTDRRTGMLGLYLASPLTRDTYLAAKALAVAGLMALVTLGPPLLLLVGLVLNDAGPDGIAELAGLLVRMVAAGAAVAVLQTSLALAVSSFTTRKAAASGAIILLLLASSALAGTLASIDGAPSGVFLVDLFSLPFELVYRIYGSSQSIDDGTGVAAEVSTAALVGAYLGWTALCWIIVRVRYQRLAISR